MKNYKGGLSYEDRAKLDAAIKTIKEMVAPVSGGFTENGVSYGYVDMIAEKTEIKRALNIINEFADNFAADIEVEEEQTIKDVSSLNGGGGWGYLVVIHKLPKVKDTYAISIHYSDPHEGGCLIGPREDGTLPKDYEDRCRKYLKAACDYEGYWFMEKLGSMLKQFGLDHLMNWSNT